MTEITDIKHLRHSNIDFIALSDRQANPKYDYKKIPLQTQS